MGWGGPAGAGRRPAGGTRWKVLEASEGVGVVRGERGPRCSPPPHGPREAAGERGGGGGQVRGGGGGAQERAALRWLPRCVRVCVPPTGTGLERVPPGTD